jgi:hypothetical protein
VRDDRGEVVLRQKVNTKWETVRAFLDNLDARATPPAVDFAFGEVCGFKGWLPQ